ncbi:type III secretion system cytoplasmic ring protein SctQ [Pseudomonas sp. LB1P83]
MTSQAAAIGPDAPTFEQALAWHDPQWTALHNRLHRPRPTWHGQFGGQAISVDWSADETAVEEGTELWLTLGEALLKLTLPAQAVAALALPYNLTLDSLPGSLLLEQELLALIAPLEELIGQPIRVRDLDASQIAPSTLQLGIDLGVQWGDDTRLSVRIHLSEVAAAWMADALDQHAPATPQDLGHLPMPMSVDSGEAWLTLPELRSLLPGDVVMLNPWADSLVRLNLGTRLRARARLEGIRLQLLEQPFAVNSMKEHHMTEVDAEPNLDAILNELQLKLVCQVGSVELSMAQLRELGNGSLLQLTPSMQEGVDLLINGLCVGQGQLVKIGDGLGVRLVRFSKL